MSEVKVDTISERTAAGGVTIDGVLIKDGVATFQTAAGSPLVFEGATADAFETTFAITDPTADRTITFPDASFTVPSTGGKILQVLQSVKTDTATTTVAAGTFADIAGTDQDAAGSVWCVKITPAATSSKILVSWDCQIGSPIANNAVIFKLFRNAVEPFLADTDGSRVRASTSGTISGAIDWVSGISGQYLDSPSLTSEVTYKIQWSQPATASIYLNRAGTDTDDTAHSRSASTITVVEIGA